MSTYLVSFERIGRCRDVPDLPVDVDDASAHAQQIAEVVYGYAGRFLGSSWYQVDVDLTDEGADGAGTIDGGRFGKFTVSYVAAKVGESK
ncbi:hypothetical protein [Streptodolium elevatio]|uniref:Uncharacterized protein n=1 Tax=Streptodolium elevatio TaxID=3157996 RepID=A0ABV3DJW8_9ACTN